MGYRRRRARGRSGTNRRRRRGKGGALLLSLLLLPLSSWLCSRGVGARRWLSSSSSPPRGFLLLPPTPMQPPLQLSFPPWRAAACPRGFCFCLWCCFAAAVSARLPLWRCHLARPRYRGLLMLPLLPLKGEPKSPSRPARPLLPLSGTRGATAAFAGYTAGSGCLAYSAAKGTPRGRGSRGAYLCVCVRACVCCERRRERERERERRGERSKGRRSKGSCFVKGEEERCSFQLSFFSLCVSFSGLPSPAAPGPFESREESRRAAQLARVLPLVVEVKRRHGRKESQETNRFDALAPSGRRKMISFAFSLSFFIQRQE